MNKKAIKSAVKLCVAIQAIDFFEGMTPSDLNVSDREFQIIMDESKSLSEKLAGNNPMTFGSANEVLNYFKTKTR
jgi:hypothetical protein